jgi:hypothetical protein
MDDSFQTGLLDILINHKKTPKTILLHIDPAAYTYTDTTRFPAGIQNLRYYYGKDALVTEYINELSWHEKYFYLFDLYRYNGRGINLIKNALTSPNRTINSNGFEAIMPTVDDSLNTVTMARQKKDEEGSFKLSRLNYLFKFIELCNQNHIKLILFTSPLYNNSYKAGPLDSILQARNIPYINYLVLGLPIVENHPTLWKDPGHLNYKGAQYESGDLAKRVMGMFDGERNH